jgi:hypothetical protein
MLHFPPNNLLVIYIIVCDWGEGKRLGEDNPSPYGFATKKETPTQRQGSSMVGGIGALLYIQRMKFHQISSTNGTSMRLNFEVGNIFGG